MIRCPFCGSDKVSHEATTYHYRCEAKACLAQWNRGGLNDKAELVEVLVIITGKLHQLARACIAYDAARNAVNADRDVLYHDMLYLARRITEAEKSAK